VTLKVDGEKSAPVATRRRGSALEDAILQAAWEELVEAGYAAFTMEAVAARAKTSRAVLYRRWSGRAELVVAAMRHHSEIVRPPLPDTGTLRGDMLALLRNLSASVGELAGVMSFLIADYFEETGQPMAALRQRVLDRNPGTQTEVIFDRAIERGEIDPARLSPRVRTVAVDLMRHDFIMTQAPVPDETIVEIVDRIFLPLVRG
jgi:AcrR family transcriptional regulator